MDNYATKRVPIVQYKAYCEKSSNDWSEYIVVYDELGNEVARSSEHHPEGFKSFHWEGYEFIMPHGYSGNPRTECYVKISDRIFFEKSSPPQ